MNCWEKDTLLRYYDQMYEEAKERNKDDDFYPIYALIEYFHDYYRYKECDYPNNNVKLDIINKLMPVIDEIRKTGAYKELKEINLFINDSLIDPYPAIELLRLIFVPHCCCNHKMKDMDTYFKIYTYIFNQLTSYNGIYCYGKCNGDGYYYSEMLEKYKFIKYIKIYIDYKEVNDFDSDEFILYVILYCIKYHLNEEEYLKILRYITANPNKVKDYYELNYSEDHLLLGYHDVVDEIIHNFDSEQKVIL